MNQRLAKFSVVAIALALALFTLADSKLFAGPAGPAQAKQQQDVPDTLSPSPAPVQPIPYSHKTHLMLGLECQGCHSNPEASGLMTFPPSSKCMQCHETVATDKPSIKKLASLAKSSESIPWVRIYVVLPGVQWNHRKHLDAGMKCETCHGQVADMDTMAKVKSVTSMAGCLNCHKIHNAATTCITCHPAWAPDMVVVKK